MMLNENSDGIPNDETIDALEESEYNFYKSVDELLDSLSRFDIKFVP